jgi:hypothetical protein
MKRSLPSKNRLIVPTLLAVSVLASVAVIEACGDAVVVERAEGGATGGGSSTSSVGSTSSNSNGFAGGFV